MLLLVAVICIPFADLVASWLLFDFIHRNDYQSVAPSVSIISTVAKSDDNLSPPLPLLHHHWHGGIIVGDEGLEVGAVSDGMVAATAAWYDAEKNVWSLPNGRVRLDCPLSFAGLSMRLGEIVSDASSVILLWDPELLGSGGSGAVFSFSTHNNYYNKENNNMSLMMSPNLNKPTTHSAGDRIAVKVSWKQSRTLVEKECKILQRLENVPHIVRCLGQPNAYRYEDGRVMIALSPVVTSDYTVDGITSSVENLKAGAAKTNAVKCIVVAMIGMLQSSVYTIDVQPLIDINTGDVVFIDFTEANRFSFSAITPMDEAAIIGYCTEMLALIPDSMKEVAAEMLRQELQNPVPPLHEKVVEILEQIWLE